MSLKNDLKSYGLKKDTILKLTKYIENNFVSKDDSRKIFEEILAMEKSHLIRQIVKMVERKTNADGFCDSDSLIKEVKELQ